MELTVFLAGIEKPEKIKLLLQLSKLQSENVINSLTRHLVDGMNLPAAAAINQIDESNLRRALNKLEEKAQIVEKIKEIDWPDYQATRLKRSVK